jgi:hypothetical protein
MALRAELCFETHVVFTISRSEIVKTTCVSEECSAAVGGKRLFTQPPKKFNLARSATKRQTLCKTLKDNLARSTDYRSLKQPRA